MKLVRVLGFVLFTIFAFYLEVTYAFSPFHNYEEERFSALENNQTKHYTLDLASQLPASGASVVLGSLPEGSIIKQAWIITKVPAVTSPATTNTISLGCDSTTDILSATDFSDDSINDIIAGSATGVASAMNYVSTSSDCLVTANFLAGDASGDGSFTAGNLGIYIEYAKK